MKEMSPKEYRNFMLEGTRTGKLASVRADGRAHVVPIWFLLDDDGTIVFTTGEGSLKAKNMMRDPRVSICVDDQRPPYSFAQVNGTAELFEAHEDLLEWSTRIGGRYMGAENAESFGRRNAVEGELLVRVTPAQVIAHKDLAD
jgi:PPOX class probable F420-dependent enzyme